MPEYRYEARDMLTGELLGDLPLGDVRWQQGRNGDGDFSGRLNLNARTTSGLALGRSLIDASRPRRTLIWVYRNHSGPQDVFRIMRRQKALGASSIVTLNASPLLGYLDRRIATGTKSYTGDVFSTARDLITRVQNHPAGDVDIQLDAELSGISRPYSPLSFGYERATFGSMLRTVAEDAGFEYAILTSLVNDAPVATFKCFAPRRGRLWSQTGLTFTAGANLLDYGLPEDGTESGVTTYGLGPGEGTAMLQATATETALLDQGYPIDELTISRKQGGVSQSALDAMTQAHKREHATTRETWELLVDPDDESAPFGSWAMGDEVKVIVEGDAHFPDGTERLLRIVRQTIAIDDDGGPERVVLDAEEAT